MQSPRTITGSSGSVHATDCAAIDGYNINLFAHNEADSTSLRHDFHHPSCITIRSATFYGSPPIRVSAATTTETEDFSRYQIKGNTKDDVCFLNTSDGMLSGGL